MPELRHTPCFPKVVKTMGETIPVARSPCGLYDTRLWQMGCQVLRREADLRTVSSKVTRQENETRQLEIGAGAGSGDHCNIRKRSRIP